jgi:uncharacterized membrane-anchored protein
MSTLTWALQRTLSPVVVIAMLGGGAVAQEKPAAGAGGTVQSKPGSAPASPTEATLTPEEKRQAEMQAAFTAAIKASTTGPSDVSLIAQAVMKLPAGYAFVPKAEGDRLMRSFGNRTGGNFAGLILPIDGADWLVTINYNAAGYVRDDDAKVWKADELLQTLREGIESGNEDRAARGFPPIEITGWVEPPAYQADTHRLVWAANVRRKGLATGGSVNYNTYLLGRDGYFELNMVGSGDIIVKDKGRAQELLAAVNYLPGKGYGDFQAGTDKVAEYGLAALVAGVAAKKLGMFALLAVAFAKMGKLIVVAVLGAVAVMARMFKRKTPDA